MIRGRVPTSAAALIMVFAMLPGFLLALYERHGQPLEVVVWQIIQCTRYLRVKERPYQTNNAYSALVRQHQMEKEVNAIVQKAKARAAAKDAGKAHPRRKERNSGHHRKYKGDGKPHSAQESIPYEAMYQDGVCRVTANTFSKCIEFLDISYQLAQADTKTAVFENLCDLYNYLDASIHVQFSFINRKIDPKQYAKSFEIRAQGDDFDDIGPSIPASCKTSL